MFAAPARINRDHDRRRLRRQNERPSDLLGDALPAHRVSVAGGTVSAHSPELPNQHPTSQVRSMAAVTVVAMAHGSATRLVATATMSTPIGTLSAMRVGVTRLAGMIMRTRR
jgi:hypothetical protein